MDDYLILTHKVLTNPEKSLEYEWLETNGLGGFASSTIYTCNTRKYHGLLVVPIAEYGDRFLLLSKYLTSVQINKEKFDLSTCRFPGVYHPSGHKYISVFSYENNFPQIMFKFGDVKIEKSIIMLQNKNALLVRYDVIDSQYPITFQSKPLLAYRNMHSLQKTNFDINGLVEKKSGHFNITPYMGMPTMYFKSDSKMEFFSAPEWYENFEHLKERDRGYDFIEDLYSPGMFEVTVKPKESFMILCTLAPISESLESLWNKEIAFRNNRSKTVTASTNASLKRKISYQTLKNNAYKFVINKERNNKPSVIAGFPWFGEWGRDTMISLPGLSIYNGNDELLLDVVNTYTEYTKNGLIPNQLNVDGSSSYNSVDASLWIFWVLQMYVKKFNDDAKKLDKVRVDYEAALRDIIIAFLDNKADNVSLSDQGFLSVGSQYTQLTWMDASVDGQPVTPRYGHPIEINALWYNALKFYVEFFLKYSGGLSDSDAVKKDYVSIAAEKKSVSSPKKITSKITTKVTGKSVATKPAAKKPTKVPVAKKPAVKSATKSAAKKPTKVPVAKKPAKVPAKTAAKTPAYKTTSADFIARITTVIEKLEANFEQYYYIQDSQYLCDTIINGQQIREIRPNQIVALALPYSAISNAIAAKVLETVTQHLFTPFGLRTLSPSDPKYQGRYKGNQKERDRQYHQGQVWPFLIGIYTDAFIRVYKQDKTKLKEYKELLINNIELQVNQRGIGGLSEICNGDLPHRSHGCPFQAWSVAEYIRSLEQL